MLRPGSSFRTKPAASNTSVGSNDSSKNKGVQSLNFDRSEKSKKRGVYVEKNLAMLPNCCTGGKCHPVTHQKPDRKQILSSLLEILSKKTISTQYSIMSVLEKSKRGARVSEITETATQHEENHSTVIVNVNTALVCDNRLPMSNVEYKHSRENNFNKKTPIPKFIPEDNHLKESFSNNNATTKEDRNIVDINNKTDYTDRCSKDHVLLKNSNTIESCSEDTNIIKKSNTQSNTKLNSASFYENYCNNNTHVEDENQSSKETIINENYSENIVISEIGIKKRCIHDGNEEYSHKNTPMISVTERKLCTKQSYSYKNKNSGIYVLKDVEGTESNYSCSESSTESSSRSWLNLISLLLLERGCDSDTISSFDELETTEVIKKSQNNNFFEYTTDRNRNPSDRSVNSRFEIETDSFKDITEPLCDQPTLKRHSSSIIQSPSEIMNEKEQPCDLRALKRNSSSVIETASEVMKNKEHGATDFYKSSPYESEEGGDNDEIDNDDDDNDEIPLAEDTKELEKENQIEEERANQVEQEEKQIEEHELEEKVSDLMEVSDRKFLSMSSFDDKFFDSEKENVPDEDDDNDEVENDRERLKLNMRNALAAQYSNYGNTMHQNEMKVYSVNPFERGPSYDDDDDFMFIRTSKPVINLNSTSFITRSINGFPSATTSGRFGKSISDYKNRKFLRSEVSYGKFPNSRYQRSEISSPKSRPSFSFNTKYSTNFLGNSPSDFSKRRYTASEYASRIGPTLSEATEKSKPKSKTRTKHTNSRPKKNPNRKKVALKKKKLEKQILLKSFIKELKKDLPVYKEPQNLFESLQKMAQNKKLSGKTKKFKYNPETLDIYQDYRTVRFQN